MCVCVHVCACVCVCVCMCVCACGNLHCMNEIVTLLNLTSFTYNFYTWLIVMFCQFVNANEWNITKTNSCVHLNVIGE